MTRVLVVDDEPPIAELVQEILQEEGYLVESAGSAAAAFGRIEQHWPEVMLLDLLMPTMDGWTFCAHVARIDAAPTCGLW